MIGRYAIAIGMGTGVTCALLFVMHLLIDTGREAVTEAKTFQISDFVRIDRTEVIETRKDKPDKPPEPELPPQMPSPDTMSSMDNAIAVSVAAPRLEAALSIEGVGFGVTDGEYLPIVKVAPVYPARALSRGIEGYVIVEFTVTRSGTTRDVFVIESTNSLFDQAAVDAASKFKYKPRVIDGEPVEVSGVRHLITFVIEE
jgi:protein TonB